MTSIRKLRRDYASADLSTIDGMLSHLTDEDAVMRFSLEDRRREVEAELAAISDEPENRAQAAVLFGGRPVVGSLGIESEFAGHVVGLVQDLVAKQHAQETDGGLGQRGVVANKAAARLHVTEALRGSFGFVLEELHPEETFVPSSLKVALDHVTDLLSAFAEPDKERFDLAIENADQRVLATVGDFFSYLDREGATLRLVSGDSDRPFDDDAIKRAAERASTTTVTDKDEDIPGQLAGILPDRHLFEFRCESPRGVISGNVDRQLSAAAAAELQNQWVNRTAVGVFRVRQVMTGGELVRETFTLKSIRETERAG